MKGDPSNPRAEELLAERALRPLDDKEHWELQQLGVDADESFDRAAAAVVVATTVIEPIPSALVERILATAPGAGGIDWRRTLPGVVMPAPLASDTMRVSADALAPATEIMQAQHEPEPEPANKLGVPAAAVETLPPPVIKRPPAIVAPSLVGKEDKPSVDPQGPTLPPEAALRPPATDLSKTIVPGGAVPAVGRVPTGNNPAVGRTPTPRQALPPLSQVPSREGPATPPPRDVLREGPATPPPREVIRNRASAESAQPVDPRNRPSSESPYAGTPSVQAPYPAQPQNRQSSESPQPYPPQQALVPHTPQPQQALVPRTPQPPVVAQAQPQGQARTPLPQDSQPFSVQQPLMTVPLSRDRSSPIPVLPAEPRDDLSARRDIARRRSAETVPLRRARRTVLPWLAAAACLFVAGGAVWWAYQHTQAAPVAPPVVATTPATERAALLANATDTTKITWTVTPDAAGRGATGDVVWSPSQQRGFMRFVGLTPNDPTQYQYQLWIFDKTRDQAFPVDGGVFDVSSTGEVVVAINPKLKVNDLGLFAVTIEKPGGVVVSKRERIVVTAART